MTDETSLVNLALQTFGNRTVITAAQLAAGSNNEAKQANLVFDNCRNSLLRMAPWDCGMKTANLIYITSTPGTPENTSPATTLWEPGQPRPPWAYEYQYPVDCLRACWVIPATQTGYAGAIPITTAVTGGVPTAWTGAPIRFKVGVDQFYMVTAAAVVAAGSDYVVGDLLTLENPNQSDDAPNGAGVIIRVATINGSGGILTATVVNQVIGADPTQGGSYFTAPTNPATVESAAGFGAGTGATFNLTYTSTQVDQRVIYTNQQYATLCYVREVTDPNVWDPMFQDAFVQFLGANICFALTGDKTLANMCINETNRLIMEARKADGNEGLTINNVTPDWIRARGIAWADSMYSGPYSAFDWGGLFPSW